MPLEAVFHQTQYDSIFRAFFNWNFFPITFITSLETKWLRRDMTQSSTNQIPRTSTTKYSCVYQTDLKILTSISVQPNNAEEPKQVTGMSLN